MRDAPGFSFPYLTTEPHKTYMDFFNERVAASMIEAWSIAPRWADLGTLGVFEVRVDVNQGVDEPNCGAYGFAACKSLGYAMQEHNRSGHLSRP